MLLQVAHWSTAIFTNGWCCSSWLAPKKYHSLSCSERACGTASVEYLPAPDLRPKNVMLLWMTMWLERWIWCHKTWNVLMYLVQVDEAGALFVRCCLTISCHYPFCTTWTEKQKMSCFHLTVSRLLCPWNSSLWIKSVQLPPKAARKWDRTYDLITGELCHGVEVGMCNNGGL